jgi:hypothetical protein
MVVSVVGKGTRKCQVRIKQMNASEQSMTCRKANQPTSKPDSVVDPGQLQVLPVYGLKGVRRRGCMNLIQALVWNVGTCWLNAKGREVASLVALQVPMTARGAEQLVVGMKLL